MFLTDHDVSYVPYKCDLDSPIPCGSLTRDYTDSSIWTALSARYKTSSVALADFAFLSER